jgi:hypothetical protein
MNSYSLLRKDEEGPTVESLSLILPMFHESFLLTSGFFLRTDK